MNCQITNEMLDKLRVKIKDYVNERTYNHILGVEREAAALCNIFLKDKVYEARAAALLHDITKNESPEKQLQYFAEFGIISNIDSLSPKLYHSKTAAELISRDFPEFDIPLIVNAVRWHTTGYKGMTMFDSIIYLADYIEDTRTFDDCIALRRFFYDNLSHQMTYGDKILHFYKTMVKSFDYTINNLICENALIDQFTLDARNYFLKLIKNADLESQYNG